MNWLRIIDYILLLILIVGFAYLDVAKQFKWSYTARIVIPIIVIILLIIEDRRK